MTAQLPSRVYRIGNPENDDHCFTDNSKSAADAIKNGYEVSEYILAAHEQEPVAVVELSDYVTAAQLSGDEPRRKAVKELYEGALVVGQNLYASPAPVPAVPDGYVMMPMKLTAENGAKYALSGEFHVLHRVTCHECGGEGCSDCDDDGWLEEKIMIGWDDIKDIYRAAVEACSIKSTGEGV